MEVPDGRQARVDLQSRFVLNDLGWVGRIKEAETGLVVVDYGLDGDIGEVPAKIELLAEQFCFCGCGELVPFESDFYSDECREHPYQDRH